MNRSVGIAFTVVYLVVAWFGGAILSVHGPDLLPYFVLAYLVLALAVLWHFARRRDLKTRTVIFAGIGIGLCLLGATVASVGLLVDWEVARAEKRAAATQVFNMRDEALLSAQGNPIGIRLRYSMRFPDSNYFWQSARADADKDMGAGIWAGARMVALTVEPPMRIKDEATGGSPAGPATRDIGVVRWYEKEKRYDFTVDLLPYFLAQSPDGTRLCISQPPAEYAAAFEKLIATENQVRFRISISGTKYAASTGQAYSPKVFYDSAVKEGAARLRGPGLGGSMTPCK